MKKIIILIFFSLIYSHNSYTKIEDKRVWENFYNNCMSKYNPSDSRISKQNFQNYCGCCADNVMDQFTLNEVLEMDKKVLSKSDKEMTQVIILNEKMKKITTYCFNTYVRAYIK